MSEVSVSVLGHGRGNPLTSAIILTKLLKGKIALNKSLLFSIIVVDLFKVGPK